MFSIAEPPDPLLWAKQPRSHLAMRFLLDAAKDRPDFRDIVAEHVRNGVCDENGKLINRWNHNAKRWEAA